MPTSKIAQKRLEAVYEAQQAVATLNVWTKGRIQKRRDGPLFKG